MRALALVLVGCGAAAEPEVAAPQAAVVVEARAEAAPVEDDGREHVREILVGACGQCHIGAISEQPGALAVFDLEETDFAARMSDAQLEAMPERIDGMGLDPESAAAVLTYVSVVFADRHHCA